MLNMRVFERNLKQQKRWAIIYNKTALFKSFILVITVEGMVHLMKVNIVWSIRQ